MELAAILIAPIGASGPVRSLLDRLASEGVTVTLVDDLASAVDVSRQTATPPAILLDLREHAAGEVEELRLVTEAVRRTIAALPTTNPIVVTGDATPRFVVTCVRAGASDVLDLALEGTATARAAVQRACLRQRDRVRDLDLARQQRAIIEELLKDLIRTERRTIDAEDALALARTTTSEMPTPAETRAPAILLIEHERGIADQLADLLEAAGIATYAYITGEEAVREAAVLADTTGLDLALVAAQLPGMDGLEAVRRLRERVPGLPAFLMTSVQDGDLAAHAADLGVVGFVHKPLTEIDDVVGRLAQLARDALQQARDQAYLDRIKQRHERVLARYRSLPRAP